MSASIIADDKAKAAKSRLLPSTRQQTILFWGVLVALFAIAFGMRLYGLGLPFDRDGYDEGVYWQTLLSMRAGYTLYQQIFYSQPPFFMFSTYPFYVLFGGTLWSARFGIAIVSLLGLVGAFLMGKSLSGRFGAIAAVLLLVIDPLYLSQSQKIEAEVSSVAFSFLAVGAAYLWWEIPEGAVGLSLAALSGVALSLGILCKLLSITSIVPISLLLLARCWQIWRKAPGTSWRSRLNSLYPMALLVIASVGTMLVVLLPLFGTYSSMIRDVITFHTDARTILINNQVHNIEILRSYFLTNWPLVIVALFGALNALLRRDWRFIPLLAWLLVSTYMLQLVVPLFYRHFIALQPALIAMAVMGLNRTFPVGGFVSHFKLSQIMPVLGALLILLNIVTDLPQYSSYYQSADRHGSDAYIGLQTQVARDLHNSITAGELVVTDGQFTAAVADRRTPPSLVDTSIVRVVSGSVTLQQLESEASQPQVHAVLFFMARLHLPQVAGFHAWVSQHFHLKYRYGPDRELWVR
jgi:4-amino-4-deoxy-L-arabinose transferase-like glycosyltransferase